MRIARRIEMFNSDLAGEIRMACLYLFLPGEERIALDQMMEECGITPESIDAAVKDVKWEVDTFRGVLRIMDVEHPIATNTDPLLIPHVSYYENKQQTLLMREMLKDLAIPGEHLLLIGNQV
jgi:hypothetical protein